jgi:MFS transporter, DHA1 family, multidrug resistance protein
MADQTAALDITARPEASSTVLQIAVLAGLAATGTLATNILLPSLPQMAVSLKVSSAAVTSAITIFLAVFAVGQLVVGPISDRYGRRWPVLIGFAVFFAGSVWCGLATDLPSLLVGRVIQAAGACATSVLSRAIARDMFSGPALARAMALIMIAMAAAPGFSPLLGGALDHYFGWRSEFALVAVFAGLGALAYGTVFGETHHATRTPLDPLAIAGNYIGLIADRRFVVPAATVSLIMGGLFSVFSAAPRVLIEAMHFTAIQLGLFFCRHRVDRVRRRHSRDQTCAALRARPLDPGWIVRGRDRQHRDAAGLTVQPLLPAVSWRHERVPARHGHRQPAGDSAGTLAVRRQSGRGIRAGRLLADDNGRDRRLARGDDLA